MNKVETQKNCCYIYAFDNEYCNKETAGVTV